MKNRICIEEVVDPCAVTDACGAGATCTADPSAPGGRACGCGAGYVSDGYNCLDVNECVSSSSSSSSSSGTAPCGQNMVCINTIGSYACECESGYELDGDGVCQDIDECENSENSCDVDGRADCTNTAGDYDCACVYPYVGNGHIFSCIAPPSVDECTRDCSDRQQCETLTPGTETCVCKQGFEAKLDFDGKLYCEDIHECETNPCNEYADCTELEPGYSCECRDGYQGDGHTCEDVDECLQGSNNCHYNADCINSLGAYVCRCKIGYRGDGIETCGLVSSEEDICGCGSNGVCDSATQTCACHDGYHVDASRRANICQDVDECRGEPCHPLAECHNVDGDYTCDCPEGMSGDGRQYCDKDECSEGTVQDYCSLNADCQNTVGAYVCTCKEGFEGDGKTCKDMSDPCSEKTCAENAMCRSVDYVAYCQCKYGYRGSGDSCVDINECAETVHDCHVDAMCTNFDGGYSCRCNSGYQGNGQQCEDIDECAEGKHDCSPDAECINVNGGFRCGDCHPGYEGDGKTCMLVTPCEQGCHAHAQCTSLAGLGYQCQCDPGYEGDGVDCTDINECTTGDNACDSNADCHNNAGSYACACAEGFAGDGYACKDVDECEVASMHTCGDHAHCRNTDGAYECICEDGYADVDGKCEDVNECDQGLASCHAHSSCVNTPGGHQCVCDDGFIDHGDHCEAQVVCHPTKASTCDFGSCAEYKGNYVCLCPEGTALTNGTCQSLDECLLPPSSPLAAHCVNAKCKNLDNGFLCKCKRGFRRQSSLECQDFDECAADVARCGEYGVCINTEGGYVCDCQPGFVSDGKTCVDRNECTERDACGDPSAAICTNVVGSFSCSCRTGFREKHGACIDIDECAEDTTLCGETEARCVNTKGSFTCSCPGGYYLNNAQCKNINECEDSPCSPNAVCVDTDGSYECVCNEGYTGNGMSCVAICSPGVCPRYQTCTVVEGRPQCSCIYTGKRCMALPGKICGTDGTTYASDSELFLTSCNSGEHIDKAYSGPCQDTCDTVPVNPFQKCEIDDDGTPTIGCQPCEEDEKNSGVICTARYGVFYNACVFKKLMCDKDNFEDPEYKPLQECAFNPGDCRYQDWKDWSACSATCGSGQKSRLRRPLNKMYTEHCHDTVETVECYSGKPCPGDPCDGHVCEGVGELCTVSSGGRPVCSCPRCPGESDEPVCGVIDAKMVSEKNLCHLKREACKVGVVEILLHKGECGDINLPVNCTVLPRSELQTDDDGCVSDQEVSTGQCSGGCGSETGFCCQATVTDQAPQQFTCGDGSTKSAMVTSIKKCECTKISEVPAP